MLIDAVIFFCHMTHMYFTDQTQKEDQMSYSKFYKCQDL